jgi:translation initiation factor IF-2
VYKTKSPFLFGVKVAEGNLHVDTPIIIPGKKLVIGKVISIQDDGKSVEVAHKGSEVCIKVDNGDHNNYTYGRQFNFNDTIVSHITRLSIDTMKTHFKNDIATKDGKLNETGMLLKKINGMLT